MTESLKYTFSIKRVKKTNDIDYINAIKIYNENIPFDIRTDSNEITSWLNEDLNKSPFVPYCFILYFNNEVAFIKPKFNSASSQWFRKSN